MEMSNRPNSLFNADSIGRPIVVVRLFGISPELERTLIENFSKQDPPKVRIGDGEPFGAADLIGAPIAGELVLRCQFFNEESCGPAAKLFGQSTPSGRMIVERIEMDADRIKEIALADSHLWSRRIGDAVYVVATKDGHLVPPFDDPDEK
jgi:hypothetical protein